MAERLSGVFWGGEGEGEGLQEKQGQGGVLSIAGCSSTPVTATCSQRPLPAAALFALMHSRRCS